MTTVALATRIPLKLKKALDAVCKKNGLKINYIVEIALLNKLEELLMDQSLRNRTGESAAELDSILNKIRAMKNNLGT